MRTDLQRGLIDIFREITCVCVTVLLSFRRAENSTVSVALRRCLWRTLLFIIVDFLWDFSVIAAFLVSLKWKVVATVQCSPTVGYTFAVSASMRSSNREDAGVERDNQLLSSCHSNSGASPIRTDGWASSTTCCLGWKIVELHCNWCRENREVDFSV